MPTEIEPITCAGVRKDKSRCTSTIIYADGYCYSHLPGIDEQRTLARRQGGINSNSVTRLNRRLQDNPTMAGVVSMLSSVIDDVRDGTLEAGRGQAIASLSRAVLASIEAAESIERLAMLSTLLERLESEGLTMDTEL